MADQHLLVKTDKQHIHAVQEGQCQAAIQPKMAKRFFDNVALYRATIRSEEPCQCWGGLLSTGKGQTDIQR